MMDCKQVERSIITTYRRRLWTKFIQAIKEYELVLPNDKVCVCISGGKDSMLLAKLFQELKLHSDFGFEVKYLVMDPGYNPVNRQKIEQNLALLQVPAKIEQTNIFDVANLQDKSPCYLCARMRRGALYAAAKEMGCNKIALGHHFDDVIETVLMSMLYAGSFQTMLPKLKSSNFEGMELIRPLYKIREKDIVAWQNHNELEFIRCACRFTEGFESGAGGEDKESKSQRYNTKELIRRLEEGNPLVAKNIFSAAANVNLDKVAGYKKKGRKYTFSELFNAGEYEE